MIATSRHLLRARDVIDSRYAEPLDVAALARVAHVSPDHFTREFRRVFGETPHQYLLTRRMERAAALLRSTDHSVTDICGEVGLTSLGSFTTSFRRLYGMTPTAYRDAHPSAASSRADPDLRADGGDAAARPAPGAGAAARTRRFSRSRRSRPPLA